MHDLIQIFVVPVMGQIQSHKHIEPKNVHAYQHGQENYVQSHEWLELGIFRGVFDLEELEDH